MYIKRLASYFVIFSYIWTLLGAPISAYALSGREIVVTQTQTLTSSTKALPFATKTHLVRKAETISTIRKHYNLSLIGFKKLNPSYKGSLKAGSLIVVPRTPLSDAMSHYLDGHNNYSSSLASAMSVQDAKSLKGSLFNSAASMASSELSGVFGRYGTLELNLAAAESSNKNKFSFANSQFTALLPLYDKGRYSIFTQIGHHQMDDKRSIGNFGIGERYFANDYMVGGNAFYDYDYTEHLSRLGIGAEYGRDFLKAAANLYLGQISSWKNPNIHSLDETNYDGVKERAANGWDIRAHAYLPSMPNIGGKLMLEQYYGDKVALLGKDILQKDPYALTVGVDYTPVPLFNFNVDYKRGKNSQHQTRFGVNLTYHLGESLAAQLNPNNVARLRSLNGGRYELVDRNNDIVLNYKIEHKVGDPDKVNTAKLTIVGHNDDKATIFPDNIDSVTLVYEPLDKAGNAVRYLTSEMIKLKGDYASKVIHPTPMIESPFGSGKYESKVTATELQGIRASLGVSSTYHITATVKNIDSNPVTITVDSNKPNPDKSTLTPQVKTTYLPTAVTTFTFTPIDFKGQPITTNISAQLTAVVKSISGDDTHTASKVTATQTNNYTFSVAPKKAGVFNVYVAYNGTQCSNMATLRVKDKQTVNGAVSKITLSTDKIRKGNEKGTLTLTLLDTDAQPIEHLDKITVSDTDNVLTFTKVTGGYGEHGIYKYTYTAKSTATVGKSTSVVVKADNVDLKSHPTVAIVDPTSVPSLDNSTLAPLTKLADTNEKVPYTYTAKKDASNNFDKPLEKAKFALVFNGEPLTATDTGLNAQTYTFTLIPPKEGSYIFHVTYDGVVVSKDATLNVAAKPSENSELAPTAGVNNGNQATANAPVTFKYSPVQQRAQAASVDISTKLKLLINGKPATSNPTFTKSNNTYSFSYTPTKAGQCTVQLAYDLADQNHVCSKLVSLTVAAEQKVSNASQVTVSKESILNNGTDTGTLTITLVDTASPAKPIAGLTKKDFLLSPSTADKLILSDVKESSKGTYTCTYTANKGTAAAPVKIAITAKGVPLTTQPQVSIVAASSVPSLEKSTLTPLDKSNATDGVPVDYTYKAKPADGIPSFNPALDAKNFKINFTTSDKASLTGNPSITNDAYNFKLTPTAGKTYKFYLTYDGIRVSKESTLTAVAGDNSKPKPESKLEATAGVTDKKATVGTEITFTYTPTFASGVSAPSDLANNLLLLMNNAKVKDVTFTKAANSNGYTCKYTPRAAATGVNFQVAYKNEADKCSATVTLEVEEDKTQPLPDSKLDHNPKAPQVGHEITFTYTPTFAQGVSAPSDLAKNLLLLMNNAKVKNVTFTKAANSNDYTCKYTPTAAATNVKFQVAYKDPKLICSKDNTFNIAS